MYNERYDVTGTLPLKTGADPTSIALNVSQKMAPIPNVA